MVSLCAIQPNFPSGQQHLHRASCFESSNSKKIVHSVAPIIFPFVTVTFPHSAGSCGVGNLHSIVFVASCGSSPVGSTLSVGSLSQYRYKFKSPPLFALG